VRIGIYTGLVVACEIGSDKSSLVQADERANRTGSSGVADAVPVFGLPPEQRFYSLVLSPKWNVS
jgi:hypothetical protein